MKQTINKTAKLVGGMILSAAAASAASYATIKMLMHTALDRELPKAAEKAGEQIAGAAIDEAVLRKLEEKALELELADTEEVELIAEDGTRLVGHWHHNPNAKRIILAMHGWRSSWSNDFGCIYEFWHKHDCSVLYVEQRAQQNSGGEYMGFGLIERFDCVKWADWIIEKCGEELPIYLAGVSMGATTVLLASELELPKAVHGILSDCGFTSPDAIWRHISEDNLHIPYGINGRIINMMYQKITSFDPCYGTTDALKKSDIPVLFVHGADDHFVPVTMTYENYQACAGPRRLVIVPGADHGMSYLVEPDRYEAEVQNFWAEFDHYQRG